MFQTKDKYISGCIPRKISGGIRYSQVFPGERLRICAYSADYRKRLRRSGRDVPCDYDGSGKCSEKSDGTVDYSQDFFGKETSLTVSGQLNGETYAQAFRSIYTFGPTFRAENSNTTRHAAEFWMIEPEIAFADLEDDMDLAEDMLKYIINYVLENAPDEMNFFNSFVTRDCWTGFTMWQIQTLPV